jgi:hypothetical protein
MYKKIVFLSLFISYLSSQIIYPSYVDIPKTLFKNQVFSIKVKAIFAVDKAPTIKTTFKNGKNIKIYSTTPYWSFVEDSTYEANIYFQILDKKAVFPDITISTTLNKREFSRTLKGFDFIAQDVGYDNLFCGVLAKELTLESFNATLYDDMNNLLVFKLSAHISNLYEFKIDNPNIVEQGLKERSSGIVDSQMVYYIITNKENKYFEFEFFNTSTLKKEKRTIPIRLKNERVSTQTDLTPQSNFLQLYKILFISLIVIVLSVIYFYKREKGYLFLITIVIVWAVFETIPNSTITIKSNTQVKILPTKNSTIFYITKYAIDADVLAKRDHFYKIQLKNNKVGWIHEKNIIKN